MKLFKRIAAAFVAISLLSSCSILGNLTQSATQQGNTTGSALAAIFNVLKTNGNIDLSDLMNVINIGKILTGANSLTNATQAYTSEFITGLMNGSGNLVNSSNVNAVLGGLQALVEQHRPVRLHGTCGQGLCERFPRRPHFRRGRQDDDERAQQPA